ncbi:MAG: hypothetical protein Q8R71_01230 [Phenylobacterium sp.]|nr:hypothetical protein [Phenylobacterium sp.]
MDLNFAFQTIDWLDHHSGLAGWAQFVGAMGAIGIAFWAAGAQTRHNRAIAAARQRDFLTAIEEAAGYVTTAFAIVNQSVERGELLHAIADLGAVRELSGSAILTKAMEGPLSDWPSPMLFVRVQTFAFVAGLIAGMADTPLETEEWPGQLRLLQSRFSGLRAAKTELEAEIARLRSL